jgi:hypothetical protein
MKLVLALLFFWNAQAEYRAFELSITDAVSGNERTELSNLDPAQYAKYHPVHPGDKIVYKTTWMCRGNTSGKPICPNPKAQ